MDNLFANVQNEYLHCIPFGNHSPPPHPPSQALQTSGTVSAPSPQWSHWSLPPEWHHGGTHTGPMQETNTERTQSS